MFGTEMIRLTMIFYLKCPQDVPLLFLKLSQLELQNFCISKTTGVPRNLYTF